MLIEHNCCHTFSRAFRRMHFLCTYFSTVLISAPLPNAATSFLCSTLVGALCRLLLLDTLRLTRDRNTSVT